MSMPVRMAVVMVVRLLAVMRMVVVMAMAVIVIVTGRMPTMMALFHGRYHT